VDILIIGGNRFFGKKLTKRLLDNGHNITLLNRGNIDDGFGDRVKRLACDRKNDQALSSLIQNKSWDIVYDQVCYDYEEAKATCEAFKDKGKRYIFTSSQSVYKAGKNRIENDFKPEEHQFESKASKTSDYSEAKRQAEVAFSRYASFPVTYVRFPIVIGQDDYTKRFEFHVERIKNEEPIYFPNIEANISFITSDFAAETLAFLATNQIYGPINSASPSPITLKDFVSIIEQAVNKKISLTSESNEKDHSPYGIEKDWFMSCEKLKSLGLVASEVKEWLPQLLR